MENIRENRKAVRQLESTQRCRRGKGAKGNADTVIHTDTLGLQQQQFLPLMKSDTFIINENRRADIFRSLSFANDALGLSNDSVSGCSQQNIIAGFSRLETKLRASGYTRTQQERHLVVTTTR